MKLKKLSLQQWTACILFIMTLGLFVYLMRSNAIIGGYDPDFHMARIETLANNLKAGHFPNPIGLEYLGGMGYGVGFFYGNFWLYPFAVLVIMGLPIYLVYRLLVLLLVAAAMIAIYYIIKQLTKNTLIASFIMPVYVLNNYYISVIFGRAAIGEAFAAIFVPLAIYFTLQIIVENKKSFLPLALVMAGLLVSHLINFILMVFIIGLIVLFNIPRIKKTPASLLTLLKAGVLSAGLSAGFLLPLVQQYGAQAFQNTAVDENGNLTLPTSSLSAIKAIDPRSVSFLHQGYIGPLIIWLLIIATIYCLIKFNKLDQRARTLLIIAIIMSIPIYSAKALFLLSKAIPAIDVIQSIWRLNVILLPIYLIIIAMFLMMVKLNYRQVIMVISFVLILISFNYTKTTTLNFVQYRANFNKLTLHHLTTDYSISRGEYLPKTFAKKYSNYNHLTAKQIVNKQKGLRLISNNHYELVLQVKPSVRQVKVPKIYYKGYSYQIKSKELSSSKAMPRSYEGMGIITLSKNHPTEQIIVRYKTTALAYIGLIISIITWIGLIVVYLRKKFSK